MAAVMAATMDGGCDGGETVMKAVVAVTCLRSIASTPSPAPPSLP